MSRNLYDSSNDTLTPLAGYQSIDSALSDTSANPVMNRVVKAALDDKAASSTVQALSSQVATNTANISTLTTKATNKVLYYTGIACSATTGNFLSYSNSAITANHVLSECVFADPSAITSDVTWTTANGSLVLNGTCASATTANIVLVKKDN